MNLPNEPKGQRAHDKDVAGKKLRVVDLATVSHKQHLLESALGSAQAVLAVYPRAATVLAQALVEQVDPDLALATWTKEMRAVLTISRLNRRQLELVATDTLCAAPDHVLAQTQNHFRLDAAQMPTREAIMALLREEEAVDPVLLQLAEGLKATNPQAAALDIELDVRSLPAAQTRDPREKLLNVARHYIEQSAANSAPEAQAGDEENKPVSQEAEAEPTLNDTPDTSDATQDSEIASLRLKNRVDLQQAHLRILQRSIEVLGERDAILTKKEIDPATARSTSIGSTATPQGKWASTKTTAEDGRRISVVTVVYRDPQGLKQTIESVRKQRYENVEYIVIDGASPDETPEVLKSYSDSIDVSVSEPDRGIYDAMNKGINLATGDYIVFMNAGDSFVDEDTLTGVATELTGEDVVYGHRYYMRDSGRVLQRSHEISYVRRRMPYCHQSAYYKRTTLKNHLFNLTYRYAADYNQVVELFIAGYNFKQIDQVLCNFVPGGASESGIRPYLEVLKIQFDNFGDGEDMRNSEYMRGFANNVPKFLENYGYSVDAP